MTASIDNTILAFLLAFQDLKTALSTQERQDLQEIAKELDIQPKAWNTHIKERLLEIIAANPELHQSYQLYHSQLNKIEEIPENLLPTDNEVNNLLPPIKPVITRGFKPKSEATGYESQINNVVIIIGKSEKPEETVKEAKFLGKLKQFLTQSNP